MCRQTGEVPTDPRAQSQGRFGPDICQPFLSPMQSASCSFSRLTLITTGEVETHFAEKETEAVAILPVWQEAPREGGEAEI